MNGVEKDVLGRQWEIGLFLRLGGSLSYGMLGVEVESCAGFVIVSACFGIGFVSRHPSCNLLSQVCCVVIQLPSRLIVICHGHPSLHSWSPLSAVMVTLLCCHGHPSLHSWSPFSALMVTLLCCHGRGSTLGYLSCGASG